MKKSILLLLFVSCFFSVFSQEQTVTETTAETATAAVKEKVEEVITEKKEALETKVKEVVAEKIESTTDEKSDVTTFYLITNGQTKAPSEQYPDPYLDGNGEKKAEQWVKILSNVKFGAAYAQELTSAKQTAQAIATSQKIGIYALDTKDIYNGSFKYNTEGKNVLIVGDNAAIAVFANTVLGNQKYTVPKIAAYSDFYIVTVSKDSKSAIKLNIE